MPPSSTWRWRYGAGLRVAEVSALKVTNIDSERMLIRVERGKGGAADIDKLDNTALYTRSRPGRCVRSPERSTSAGDSSREISPNGRAVRALVEVADIFRSAAPA